MSRHSISPKFFNYNGDSRAKHSWCMPIMWQLLWLYVAKKTGRTPARKNGPHTAKHWWNKRVRIARKNKRQAEIATQLRAVPMGKRAVKALQFDRKIEAFTKIDDTSNAVHEIFKDAAKLTGRFSPFAYLQIQEGNRV